MTQLRLRHQNRNAAVSALRIALAAFLLRPRNKRQTCPRLAASEVPSLDSLPGHNLKNIVQI